MQPAAREISNCPTCGVALEETATGDLGCMVCLLRVGLSDQQTPTGDSISSTDGPFGIYVIDRRDDGSLFELGRGAMGITYRATDTTLDRKVALKIIDIELAARSGEARERFMRGARASAALRHENTATVYQFGIREETGQCFYAMELVDGETLEERVHRTGPLDIRATIAVAQQVALALGAAEKRGLIHRDLKPANLMIVSPEDQTSGTSEKVVVKVIDFGLAKALTARGDPMFVTRGGFVGTPAFASPEQFSNAPLDVRSDIYSLGVTLWFALTGKTPFAGRNVDEIRLAQQSAPRIEQLKAAHVPSRLTSLLESMLAQESAARPGAQDLIARLRRCQSQANGFGKRTRLTACLVLIFAVAALIVLLAPRFGNPRRATGASNPAAHAAYLKGRELWNKRGHSNCKQAVKYFDEAIALDPNYAEAYAGLADSYPLIANDDPLIARSEDYAKATAAAKKAIELDPMLANPHAALGLIAMNYEYDWATAEREYKRAIELNPNYPTAHHWYAEYLITQGRSDESLTEIRRAQQLDPLSVSISSDVGKILYYSRQYDEAIDQCRKTIAMDSSFLSPHHWLGLTYTEQKRFDDAIAEFKAGAWEKWETNPWILSMIGRTLAMAGRKGEAQKIVTELRQLANRHDFEPQWFMPVYIGLGENDEAFALLEREYETRSTGLPCLKVHPLYDTLRSDPRFVDLMRRMGFVP